MGWVQLSRGSTVRSPFVKYYIHDSVFMVTGLWLHLAFTALAQTSSDKRGLPINSTLHTGVYTVQYTAHYYTNSFLYTFGLSGYIMASWLFGVSKLTAEQIVDTKDTPPVPTAVNPEPAKTLPTEPQLLYNLQPPEPKMSDLKPTSMLDNIPFVLSNQIIVNTNNYSYNLEATKRNLLSLKQMLDSDAFNYDFSNDKRLVSDTSMYKA
ncbi:hypothetical protein AGLY_001845 [Aphis glycines]|uniref:UMA domain-containing protein n=1 Tax=Aphis glycines TaxID=307491 RepID=A0A6G0U4I2_APHGL|nr:hypothetical protein AGLY_001845 [Aphis glycines]